MDYKNYKNVYIRPPFIALIRFVKLAGAASSGGQSKIMVDSGQVTLNGEVCTMRYKKLFDGDKVIVDGKLYNCKLIKDYGSEKSEKSEKLDYDFGKSEKTEKTEKAEKYDSEKAEG